MMSAPEHFEVSYTINPWMQPSQWSVSPKKLAGDAKRGWNQLKKTYERLGAEIEVQKPAAGLPDMVFTANAAVVLDRKVLLARFCARSGRVKKRITEIFSKRCAHAASSIKSSTRRRDSTSKAPAMRSGMRRGD